MNLTLDMRPTTFDEVVGLEPQIEAIRNAIASGNRKPFLLQGLFGCGKTTLAQIIAKEVQGWEFTGTPVIELVNAASIRGIDGAREIAQKAQNYPMQGKFRIIILDEAHQLTKDAQQVFLPVFEQNIPTVFILTTTNPEKLNEGVKDRCIAIPALTGLNDAGRAILIARAAQFANYEGDTSAFLAAAAKAKIVSPRKLLKSFEGVLNGLTPEQAIATATLQVTPEFHEIALGVVFGQWEKPYMLPWIKDKEGNPVKYQGVGAQLKALDEKLKKKPTVEGEQAADGAEDAVDEEDLAGRPEVARALRAITAAFLKNAVLKGGVKATRAAEALFKLAHSTSPSAFDTGMEFATTVGGLYRVWATVNPPKA